jgi:hypothetical protein
VKKGEEKGERRERSRRRSERREIEREREEKEKRGEREREEKEKRGEREREKREKVVGCGAGGGGWGEKLLISLMIKRSAAFFQNYLVQSWSTVPWPQAMVIYKKKKKKKRKKAKKRNKKVFKQMQELFMQTWTTKKLFISSSTFSSYLPLSLPLLLPLLSLPPSSSSIFLGRLLWPHGPTYPEQVTPNITVQNTCSNSLFPVTPSSVFTLKPVDKCPSILAKNPHHTDNGMERMRGEKEERERGEKEGWGGEGVDGNIFPVTPSSVFTLKPVDKCPSLLAKNPHHTDKGIERRRVEKAERKRRERGEREGEKKRRERGERERESERGRGERWMGIYF